MPCSRATPSVPRPHTMPSCLTCHAPALYGSRPHAADTHAPHVPQTPASSPMTPIPKKSNQIKISYLAFFFHFYCLFVQNTLFTGSYVTEQVRARWDWRETEPLWVFLKEPRTPTFTKTTPPHPLPHLGFQKARIFRVPSGVGDKDRGKGHTKIFG